MDISTELRSRMAAKRVTVAEVAEIVGRTRAIVSSYRMGQRPIPLDVARKLYDADLLSAETILGEQSA